MCCHLRRNLLGSVESDALEVGRVAVEGVEVDPVTDAGDAGLVAELPEGPGSSDAG